MQNNKNRNEFRSVKSKERYKLRPLCNKCLQDLKHTAKEVVFTFLCISPLCTAERLEKELNWALSEWCENPAVKTWYYWEYKERVTSSQELMCTLENQECECLLISNLRKSSSEGWCRTANFCMWQFSRNCQCFL